MPSAEHIYLAKTAYKTFWEAFDGKEPSPYENISEEEKQAWEASAEAVSLLVMHTLMQGQTYVRRPPEGFRV